MVNKVHTLTTVASPPRFAFLLSIHSCAVPFPIRRAFFFFGVLICDIITTFYRYQFRPDTAAHVIRLAFFQKGTKSFIPPFQYPLTSPRLCFHPAMEPRLSRPPTSPTTEYQSAIQFYYSVRDANILKEDEEIGGRSFILVNNVTAVLKENQGDSQWEDSQISRLLEAAYRRFQFQPPLQRSHQILDRLPIFYTLLDLDLGHKIHKFVEDGITKLPIELPKLRELLYTHGQEDNAEKFYKQQWRWCAMNFEWGMSRKAHSHDHIVPITARTPIEPTRDGLPKTDRRASLWVVEVPTSFVDKEIQDKLRSPDEEEPPPTCEIDSVCCIVWPLVDSVLS